MKNIIVVSVRQMVEMICRTGDLGSGGFFTPVRALEGTLGHQKLQKMRGENYETEVPLKKELEAEGLQLLVEGRADGIENDLVEEIKTTYKPREQLGFSTNALHRAQLLCYGYLLAEERGLESVRLRLTYYRLENEEEIHFDETWTRGALSEFFLSVVSQYAKWIKLEEEHLAARKTSLDALTFPFSTYRKGQREMAGIVYRTIRDSGAVFLQAPTGIGKTISTLFPSLKAMGTEMTERIFYLTAKTATATVAVEALRLLKEKKESFNLWSVHVMAKDKLCPLESIQCDAAHCHYAKGHFDRIQGALWNLLQEQRIMDAGVISEYAKRYEVCPYELAIEASTWCDVIIGDYNYAFDPGAMLKSYFDGKEHNYTLLVDEAHNLPDRARSMFSACIGTEEIHQALKAITGKGAAQRQLRHHLVDLEEKIRALKEEKKDHPDQSVQVFASADTAVLNQMTLLSGRLNEYFEKQEENLQDNALLDFYFSLQFFLKMQEEFDESSVIDLRSREEREEYHLDCVHPASKLRRVYAPLRAIIFFSATFSPIEYYKELICGSDPKIPAYLLPSAFDPSKRAIISISDIRTEYQNREMSIPAVAAAIYRTYNAKPGHYLVFFPSYSYLEQVRSFFQDAYPSIPAWPQVSGMDDRQKAEYLAHFDEHGENGIGFAVLGGMFSEGIDLKGERLIGVMVVTVGIPQIGIERDLIRNHMESFCGRGYDWAYFFPGLGKVFQAAGRLIRTEEDRGVIVLIDQRYSQERYRKYFPPDWRVREISSAQIGPVLADFWQHQEEVTTT